MIAKAIALLLIENKTTIPHVEDTLTRFHLLPLLPSVLDELKHHEKELKILETIYIESPFPITSDNRDSIKKLLGAEDKEHVVLENKNLLAGFRARYKGKEVDSSMERVLNTFINN